jgi:tetratricopeptide (TPR) repeat protein
LTTAWRVNTIAESVVLLRMVERFRRPQFWNIDAYEDCLANAYLELGHFDEAIAEYGRILKLNPNYPLVHYHLAQAVRGKKPN